MASPLKLVTRHVTFDGSVTPIYTIFGMPEKTWIGTLAIRAAIGNLGVVYWMDEDGAAGGYLQDEEAVTLDFGAGMSLMKNIFIQGTAGESAYLSAGISIDYFDNG